MHPAHTREFTARPPLVSIGLPVRNGERYLGEALEALLAQTFQDFELIISDNASDDRTEHIARFYAARDPRVRYVRNAANLGLARNYRQVFELASGEYFKWAPYDDLCDPELLARCVEVLDRHPSVVLAYARSLIIDEEGRVTAPYEDNLHLQAASACDRFKDLYRNLRLCHALYGLIRTDVLRRTPLIGSYLASDVVLLAELTLYGTFWEIPQFLYRRRIHPASSNNIEIGQLLEFYDPRRKGQIALREWRHSWEYFRAMCRAPLGSAEKARLFLFLLRFGFWNRRQLTAELSLLLRHAMLRRS